MRFFAKSFDFGSHIKCYIDSETAFVALLLFFVWLFVKVQI